MEKHSHFLEGVFFGALLGGIVALLYTPFSGKETREKIKKLADDNQELIEDTKDKTENLIHKTKEAIEAGFEKISTMIQEKSRKK